MSVSLPCSNGTIEIHEHKGSGECSGGCGLKGGGMARIQVGDVPPFAFCGNCLAGAMVDRIDKNERERSPS